MAILPRSLSLGPIFSLHASLPASSTGLSHGQNLHKLSAPDEPLSSGFYECDGREWNEHGISTGKPARFSVDAEGSALDSAGEDVDFDDVTIALFDEVVDDLLQIAKDAAVDINDLTITPSTCSLSEPANCLGVDASAQPLNPTEKPAPSLLAASSCSRQSLSIQKRKRLSAKLMKKPTPESSVVCLGARRVTKHLSMPRSARATAALIRQLQQENDSLRDRQKLLREEVARVRKQVVEHLSTTTPSTA